MFDASDLCRTLKTAVAGLSIVVAASFLAIGQTSTSMPSPQSTIDSATRDELNMGIAAYKSGRYDEAIGDFEKAAELAPGLPLAKKYLATALAQTVIPALNTPDNLKTAGQAIGVFQQVLANDPHDVNSMKQVAGIYFSIQKLEDAKEWQKKVLNEDPRDAEAAYTIGVIDWTRAHENVQKALALNGFMDDGEGNTKAPPEVLETIKSENGVLVAEALEYLHRAVENQPDYADAMAYLNLVYRRKADVDWTDEAARADDVAQAREWARKSMFTRKANEDEKAAAPETRQP